MSTLRTRFVVAASLARLESEGLALALVLLLLDRTGSAAQAALLVACTTLPQLALGPLLAPLLDRAADPWPRLATAAAVNGAATAGLAATAGRAPIVVPAALSVLVAGTEPLLSGGLSASASRTLSQLGPRRGGRSGPPETARIQAWDSFGYNLGGLAATALVTILAVVAGPAVATGTLAAGSGLAALALWTLRPRPSTGIRRPAAGGEPGGDDGTTLARAVRALLTDPVLRATTVATTLANGSMGALPFAAVAAAGSRDRDITAGGHIVTTISVGAVVGSAVMTLTPPSRRPALAVFVALSGIGGALLAAGLGPWPVMVAAALVVGLLDAPLLVGTFGVRTGHSPVGIQATVFTVAASAKLGAASLGALAAGRLLDGRSTSWGLAAIGVIHLLAVGAGVASGAVRFRGASPARPAGPAPEPSRQVPPSG